MYQPRAKLGLSASARSTNAIMAPMSSPKCASARAAFAEDARIVAGHLQGSPGEIGALPAVRLRDLRSDRR